MPLGIIVDRLDRNTAVASTGLFVTSAAFLFPSIPLLCAVLLGLGNCLYHIGGGIEVLNLDGKRQWMLGIFVSPGALGLYTGTLLARSGILSLSLGGVAIFLLSAVTILLLHLTYPLNISSENAKFSLKTSGRYPAAAAVCLFTVVILRSYVGATLNTPWKSGIVLPLLAVAALALGKAVGGLLSDRFGALPTALCSLSLCALLFLFSDNALCGLLAIFLFNMTMPQTLFAMASLFPRAKGFAFGTLTFALFLGCLPTLLSLPPILAGKPWVQFAEAALSLALLAVGLICCRKGGKTDE